MSRRRITRLILGWSSVNGTDSRGQRGAQSCIVSLPAAIRLACSSAHASPVKVAPCSPRASGSVAKSCGSVSGLVGGLVMVLFLWWWWWHAPAPPRCGDIRRASRAPERVSGSALGSPPDRRRRAAPAALSAVPDSRERIPLLRARRRQPVARARSHLEEEGCYATGTALLPHCLLVVPPLSALGQSPLPYQGNPRCPVRGVALPYQGNPRCPVRGVALPYQGNPRCPVLRQTGQPPLPYPAALMPDRARPVMRETSAPSAHPGSGWSRRAPAREAVGAPRARHSRTCLTAPRAPAGPSSSPPRLGRARRSRARGP